MTSLANVYKIYDALHGFIRFNALEKQVIDSAPFQRLHSIHQLGIAYLVYPGATHSRFEHSLGTMELATQIFHRISSPYCPFEDKEYWLQIIRLAALCHDLGHLPFSHDAESVLLESEGHEGWTLKVIAHLRPIWDLVGSYFPGKDIERDIIKMAIGEKKLHQIAPDHRFSQLESVLSHIVTGDFFGADRIDYLLRDARCTGVSHGLFDYLQLIETLRVVPVEGRLELAVEENGVDSCEALLLARYFMHQRVYKYASVQAHKFHLARFMKVLFNRGEYLSVLESYLSLTDNEVTVAFREAATHPSSPGHRDAAALLFRENRFRAIGVPAQVKLEELEGVRSALGISSEDCFIKPATHGQKASSFFVQTGSRGVISAEECCNVRITPRPLHWVYIDPAWEKLFCLHIQ